MGERTATTDFVCIWETVAKEGWTSWRIIPVRVGLYKGPICNCSPTVRWHKAYKPTTQQITTNNASIFKIQWNSHNTKYTLNILNPIQNRRHSYHVHQMHFWNHQSQDWRALLASLGHQTILRWLSGFFLVKGKCVIFKAIVSLERKNWVAVIMTLGSGES